MKPINKDPWYNTPKSASDDMEYLSIALLGECNEDCIFCYVDGSRKGEWALPDLKKIIVESKEIGMKKIQLSGGEPMLYRYLEETLEFLKKENIETLLVTNGSIMTSEDAKMLHDYKVNVGISFETIDERISDMLTQTPGSHKAKLEAIENLISAGYTKDIPMNIIMKTFTFNFPTYVETWKWAVDKGIQPILDRAIPGVRCPPEWIISGKDLRNLMDEIGNIQGVYHRIPFVNNEGCNKLSCGTHIDVDGEVYPCGGIPLSMGNVKNGSIKDIWKNSDVAKTCKTIDTKIYGSCGSCDEKKICHGCRAVPCAVFGDLAAPDPYCWKYDPNLKQNNVG